MDTDKSEIDSNIDITVEVEEQIVLNLKKTKPNNVIIADTNKYNKALKEVKYLLDKTNINLFNLPAIIKSIMEVIDNIPMSGPNKKIYALKIIREIVDEKTFGEEEAVLLLLIDNGNVGNMIDLIIDATRGNLNINALSNTVGSCATACIPYIYSKKYGKKLLNKK